MPRNTARAAFDPPAGRVKGSGGDRRARYDAWRMPRTRPKHCRPHAYRVFAEQAARLGEPDALWRCAVAISMHELEGVDFAAIDARLQSLADRIDERVCSGQHRALIAHAHDVLFREEGFHGNLDDYYSPYNSYLPAVLETRRGLPITLCLVYKCVVERLGLRVWGVNAPGHFLAGVEIDGEPMLVDPFHGGRPLSREEAFALIEETTGARVPRSAALLEPATTRDWLVRILRNLQDAFLREDRAADAAAMHELLQLPV